MAGRAVGAATVGRPRASPCVPVPAGAARPAARAGAAGARRACAHRGRPGPAARPARGDGQRWPEVPWLSWWTARIRSPSRPAARARAAGARRPAGRARPAAYVARGSPTTRDERATAAWGSPTTRDERATAAWGTAPDDVTAATNAQQV